MAKRGLFQSIFGGKSEKNKDFHAYKLLSSWESTFVPYSGNMWDINTVRSAVDAFARRASTAQPRHVRQSAETTVAVNDYIDRILQFRPNPYMTAADFYYKLAAQYKVYNNAIAYPVFDETGRLTAVYPINAQYFELLEYMGTLYCRFTFATGATTFANIPELSTSGGISSSTIFSATATSRSIPHSRQRIRSIRA